ncbi:hypothetical protein AAG617_20985, partial [Enterobacter cloacae]|uniref:tyrosine-type recombinase/integrase n=1 Tax=Enterobacter cloacae TaxID=550 RepID=UPI00315B54C4
HGDVLMWLMKTLLTSGCTNQRGAGQMSTILHEEGFNSAWIETQLAHVDKNAIRGTYNHAQYLEGRREMMQKYADYVESLVSRGV